VAHQWGATSGLMAFLMTVVRGWISSVSFDATLQAALLALTVLYGLGWLGGKMWSVAFPLPER
jgi:hypothetical protein